MDSGDLTARLKLSEAYVAGLCGIMVDLAIEHLNTVGPTEANIVQLRAFLDRSTKSAYEVNDNLEAEQAAIGGILVLVKHIDQHIRNRIKRDDSN